jgi:hypothetical protein
MNKSGAQSSVVKSKTKWLLPLTGGVLRAQPNQMPELDRSDEKAVNLGSSSDSPDEIMMMALPRAASSRIKLRTRLFSRTNRAAVYIIE